MGLKSKTEAKGKSHPVQTIEQSKISGENIGSIQEKTSTIRIVPLSGIIPGVPHTTIIEPGIQTRCNRQNSSSLSPKTKP